MSDEDVRALAEMMQSLADYRPRRNRMEPYARALLAAEEALKAFALFAERFDARPIRGLDDTLYSIHGGGDCPGAADFKLSDCKAARAALSLLREAIGSPTSEVK